MSLFNMSNLSGKDTKAMPYAPDFTTKIQIWQSEILSILQFFQLGYLMIFRSSKFEMVL